MKVTQEKLPDSQIGLEIEITAETSQKTYDTVVNNLARSTHIPGFRKGKIPRQVLIQRLGSQRLKAAALEEIVQKSVEQAIKQESIEALGNYKLRSDFDDLIQKFTPGQPFTFSASVDVPPSVQLGDYKNLNIKAEEVPYDPKKTDQWFEDQREKYVTLVPIEDRPAQMGDVVIIDYQGKYADDEEDAGEPIEGVQGQDFQVELGEGRFIEGFVEGILGMNPQETKDVEATFPEDYPQENLAGKKAVFTITVKELKAKELPELDDDFAEQLGENSEQKFETLAEWREYIENQFKEQADKETKNQIHGAIIEELAKISTVDLPETIIQEEVTNLLKETAMQIQQMGVDLKNFFNPEMISRMRENARPEAKERLSKTLIIEEIAKVEGIEPDEQAIEERYNKVKQQLSDQDIDLERLLEVVTDELRSQKTLDWLQEQATVELVPEGTLNPPEPEEDSEESTEEVIDVKATESESEA